jgi:hypothetical protein
VVTLQNAKPASFRNKGLGPNTSMICNVTLQLGNFSFILGEYIFIFATFLFRELSHQGRDFFLQGDYETALGVKQSDLFHAIKN